METDPLMMPSSSTFFLRDSSRYLIGIGLLLTVTSLWTFSNFITAGLQTGTDSYEKPFLITYLNTTTFTLYLIPSYIRLRKTKPDTTYEAVRTDDTEVPQNLPTNGAGPQPRSSLEINEPGDKGQTSSGKLSIRETAIIAAWWSAIWFVANFAVNISLAWTSVASVTILSSTSGFFTLVLGSLVRVEDMNKTKIFAVIASFVGVLLVTSSDSNLSDDTPVESLPTRPILGDATALLGAMCYAIYAILLKVKLGDEYRADTQLMLGFAGLYNTFCLIPAFFLLHWTGLEPFQLPPTSTAWLICIINMVITFFSDYIYVLAVLKTSPMVVTVGLSLTIPLTLVLSPFIPYASSGAITFTSLLGAVLVIGAFAILGWQGRETEGAAVPTETAAGS